MEETDLRIDGYIGDELDESAASGRGMRALLAKRTGDLTIWINSPGGSVTEASQIYTAIREYKGHTRICVDGIAASAASIIAMAGDELCMAPTSYLMVHRASTIAIGNVDDMEETARMLRAVDEGLVDTYRAKTGMSRAKIRQLLKDESWINATAAKAMGLCDKVLYQDGDKAEDGEESAPAPGGTLAAAVAYLGAYHPGQCVMASAGKLYKPEDYQNDPDDPDDEPEDENDDEAREPDDRTSGGALRDRARYQLLLDIAQIEEE